MRVGKAALLYLTLRLHSFEATQSSGAEGCPWGGAQVYSTQQARSDIDSVYSMGLFDDVNILPQPAEDSTLEHPKACTRPASRIIAYVHRPGPVST